MCRRTRSFLPLLLLMLATPACGGPAWLEDVEADTPLRLSEVGLFSDVGALAPADRVVDYEPNWPLWSSGTDKQRLVHVPEGAKVDTAKAEGWDFPPGTVLAKTFSLPGGAPIETRLIFRREAGWEYAAYLWNEAGSDADLLEGNWLEAKMDLQDPSGEPFPYTVPARLDCRTCHETSQGKTGTPVLGLGPLQLPASLVEAPFFDGPAPTASVEGRSGPETEALGYFVGNCIACHNDGSGENAAFSLYPDVAVANSVDHPTESETGEGIRVVPGDPESSVVFISVVRAGEPGYMGPFKVMPPLAITRVDPAAEAILSEWILGLPAAGAGP
jgi:hypothetical protein